ncbi:MAG: heme biosynthesis HemY N-terminal domain-containing protein [Alphaproteobacteria bacterium]|nr:heme biosynthesis HemY N-terminal domain-containing protein [Alphaproteobacteria bacterium]
MKLFGFILRLILVVGLVIWLADRPGTAQIEWHDVVIETSAAVLAVIVAAIAYGLLLLHRIWRFFVDGPRVWKLNRTIGKLEDGQKALAKGLACIAGCDASEAGRQAVKARKLLGETPVTRLLQAQAAQMAGDIKAAETLYRAMTKDDETAVLGYRGLIMNALRRGQMDEATRLCGQLEGVDPKLPWLNLVRFEIATRLGQWQGARDVLTQARKDKVLPAPLTARHEAALLLADAQVALRDSRPVDALNLAERSRKLMPDWMPASLALAEAQIVTKHERAALRTIDRAWEKQPHRDLLPLFYWATQSGKPLEQFKQIEKMTRSSREAFETLMALGDAALRAGLWGEARRFLSALVHRGDATRSTYQKLALLEQKGAQDDRAASLWLAKAVAAPLDARWVCESCGAAHDGWSATCPSCRAFNRIDWQVPGQPREGQKTGSQPLALQDYLA